MEYFKLLEAFSQRDVFHCQRSWVVSGSVIGSDFLWYSGERLTFTLLTCILPFTCILGFFFRHFRMFFSSVFFFFRFFYLLTLMLMVLSCFQSGLIFVHFGLSIPCRFPHWSFLFSFCIIYITTSITSIVISHSCKLQLFFGTPLPLSGQITPQTSFTARHFILTGQP